MMPPTANDLDHDLPFGSAKAEESQAKVQVVRSPPLSDKPGNKRYDETT